MSSSPVLIVVTVKAETDKAFLVVCEGEEVWLPKSQLIEDESEMLAKGESGTLALPYWLAKEKGLT